MSPETVTDQQASTQELAQGLTGQRAYLARAQVRQARRAMREHIRYWGTGAARRRHLQIEALERKEWHGRVVFKLRCERCGRARWEGEAVCWWILALTRHVCAWCLVKG